MSLEKEKQKLGKDFYHKEHTNSNNNVTGAPETPLIETMYNNKIRFGKTNMGIRKFVTYVLIPPFMFTFCGFV